MSLVKCPECGKTVSDTAEACPECGYAVKAHYEKIRKEEAELARLKAEEEKRLAEEKEKKETEEQRQKEIIEKLEKRIESDSGLMPWFIGITLVFGILTVLTFAARLGLLIVAFGFFTLCGVLVCAVSIVGINEAQEDLELVKISVDSYEKRVEERKVEVEEREKIGNS